MTYIENTEYFRDSNWRFWFSWWMEIEAIVFIQRLLVWKIESPGSADVMNAQFVLTPKCGYKSEIECKLWLQIQAWSQIKI